MLQLPLLPVALLASLAAAQTTTFSAPAAAATTSACGAQPVLEQCLGSTELIAAACAATDYNCLCQKWTDVVVCFNVCPDDTRLAGLQNTKDSYCAYATTVTAAPTTASATGTPTVTAAGSTRSVASGSRSATASAAAGTATGESGAGRVVLGAGGVLMGVAGFAGVFL
ncbi:hypothetical protein QTJ16_005558 [Diplocarpon rosae]|uniref:GPI anchored serine-threonine rich protein n=1 Tax=Diplocarpon rosae TaxID=946125 RepID=A0AAD9WDR7_9HELO|nr:hypothetical protein QTJ16_005558 [Diplocarpon rosae]